MPRDRVIFRLTHIFAMVKHKYLKSGALDPRLYQETILGTAAGKNTLVVLPTGLGKTHIAALLAAKRLEDRPGSRVLFLAPTKPLVEQHCSTLRDAIDLLDEEFVVFTGAVPPEKRSEIYKASRIMFATPQVIQNDIISNRLALDDISLLVVDEAHRASGEYPYGFLAKRYMDTAKSPRILALTASPGSTREETERVCSELFIEAVEARARDDPDVLEYVQKRAFEWIAVELPVDFKKMRANLESILKDYLLRLKSAGVVKSASVKYVRKRQILALQGQLAVTARENPDLYQHLSTLASVLKVHHSIELLETQGIAPLCEYFEKLESDRSKAAQGIRGDERFKATKSLAELLKKEGVEHPKLERLMHLLEGEKRAIVFANYRSSVNTIIKALEERGISANRLIGQAKEGISQKEQMARLNAFREGKYRVLVCTSVGEEGLDIPAVDRVVFYEPVPSAIRSIQRSGRTARHRPGKVSVLVAKGTKDEAYYWSAHHKEKRMGRTLQGINKSRAQRTLDKYSPQENVVVFADTRESGSGVLKKLSELGIEIRLKQLDVADFQLSERVGIERKQAKDFLQSLLDGRLLKQAKALASVFEKPLLIVEGGPLYGLRNVHPNAIRGALASLSLDFNVPVLYSEGVDDTAAFIAVIAKREQLDLKKEIALRGGRASMSLAERQQYIVESLPAVGPTLAKRLLGKFETVEGVLTAGEGKLREVETIGEKKAREIRKALESKYKES